MFMQNSIAKRYKSGNPALLSAHFADAVSQKKEKTVSLACDGVIGRQPASGRISGGQMSTAIVAKGTSGHGPKSAFRVLAC
jgi:hypothetical protein